MVKGTMKTRSIEIGVAKSVYSAIERMVSKRRAFCILFA